MKLAAPLALLFASPALADTPAAWPTGLYSDVHSVPETGDLLGLETRFYEEAGRHMVEIAWCEGWCTQTYVSEVTRGDNGFIFGLTQTATGAEGDVDVAYHVVVWPVRGGLGYSMYQGRENIDPDGKPGRMRRTNKLFGIAVAKSGKD